MGACTFRTSGRGRSAKDVYDNLVEEAENEYGHDPYNGTISTTDGFSDVTNQWKASKLEINEFINKKLDDSGKRDCFCVCLEPPKLNTSKTKTKVENVVSKGTRKWALRYAVYDYDNKVGSYRTKGEAVKAARIHTEKVLRPTLITMEKLLESGVPNVARVVYKRSVNEKDGKWIFFGWAAE